MMTNERQRAEFEAWAARIGLCVTGKYAETINGLCAESAFKAGYKAALQSRDREDAERYRFIRAKVYASNAYGRASWKFHYDNLPLPLDNPTRGSVKQHFEDAIDHARRVEGDNNG